MNRAIAWFARNGVAANLLMAIILIGGFLTFPTIKQEIFPEFSTDMISVSVIYPGAAPQEVEEGVCIRIEEQLQGINGIKKLTSTASEGQGSVRIELLEGEDVSSVRDEVKTRVDAIETFPEEIESPIIQEVLVRRQVINIAVSGPTDEKTLKRLAEKVRDEVSALPAITQVEMAAFRPYEISIEVSERDLRRYGLTFDQVANAVRRSSLDLPGGSVKTSGGEILLRAKGQAYDGAQFENLPLITRADGVHLRLGDIAQVRDTFAETDQMARFDGQPVVLIPVFRVGEQRALEIADAVNQYVAEAQAEMPEGIQLVTWQDDSEPLRSRLELVMRNGLQGLLLVVAILAFFLRLRLSFWVSLGIPISFLGTFLLLPNLGVSVNLISLFAFIVVLGIVVDDAIIVGENIFAHYERGKTGLRAAIDGAREMMVPVVFAVLTSVVAFSPMLAVPGPTGKIFRVLPLVVIPTLLFSLVESLFILPNHLSHSKGRASRSSSSASTTDAPIRRRSAGGLLDRPLKWFIRTIYRPLLGSCLAWRYLTAATALVVFVLTVSLLGAGWLQFNFMPRIEAENVLAVLAMPLGTPMDQTAQAVGRLEQSAERLRQEVDGERPGQESVFRHMLASIGEQPTAARQNRMGRRGLTAVSAAHLGEVNIELAESEHRELSSQELAERWRELTRPIPDATELSFTSSLFSAGEAINIELTALDLEVLRRAADELKGRLTAYPGVFDITHSFRPGKKEVKLEVLPEAALLGLSQLDLARQVRQAFYGEEAQRIQRGRDDLKVMVRYPEAERRSLADLENMRIRTLDGKQVPFSTVARAEFGIGYSSIKRVDRRRAINVTADVDSNQANANEIIATLQQSDLPEILQKYPQVSYTLEGEQREQSEMLFSLLGGFLLALLVMYTLMAVPLRSYSQPLLIMSAIPFGFVGAIWGHLLMGHGLSILSMFGMVALAGVVVNDNLVLVDFVNRNRRTGESLRETVQKAGIRRFRPILLTSLTTFGGLTPMLLEKSLQAQFLIPMAISLAFGVMFSTSVSLILVPSLYLILEDLKGLVFRTHPQELEAPLPAG